MSTSLLSAAASATRTLAASASASHSAAPAKKANPDGVLWKARNKEYPNQIWYFCAACIALLTLVNLTSILVRRFRRSSPFVARARGPVTLTRIPAAATHLFRWLAFYSTVSFGGYTLDLAELFMACGYIAVIYAWGFVNSTSLKGQVLLVNYWSNRTGDIAATQFPLMIALGMRNNIIGYLTGISLDKMNLLHRVVARALCVMIWIHGAGRVYIAIGNGENAQNVQEGWFRWGIAAAVPFTLLCVFSVRTVRKRSYEAFLIAHFFVAIVLLVGAYYHAKAKNKAVEIWPSFVIWGFDRTLRFIRTFVANSGYIHFLGKSDARANALEADVHVVSPKLLRVSVLLPNRVHWSPGQIAYLSVPSVSRTPWEAHPFSIASLDTSASASSTNSSRDEKQGELSASSSSSSIVVPSPGYTKEAVFFIRVHRGFTNRLLDAAAAAKGPARFNAFVDGPYCTPPTALGYSSVLLIAGGSGVSFTLPLLLDLARAARLNANPCCGRVVFVWSVRESDQIDAVAPLLSAALADLDTKTLGLEIRIHVTRNMEDTDGTEDVAAGDDDEKDVPASPTSSVTAARRLRRFECVTVSQGRPDIDELLRTEVAAASGAMAVNVCGTRGLAKHVRRALKKGTSAADVLRGGPSVHLHVESFGGA
ncbi:unnamed protein product [Mycena citricolor]|uniref:FAD-binding FR-type domain-containing protein n=1 Tax=Mycena citricolor TaxID=2018698 RepID=A0AAD2GZ30_9AGAR|nr:unnamed protein product [Mycena citricolor]CAK5266975.1 unnamed protein product [Mycena citricolor]